MHVPGLICSTKVRCLVQPWPPPCSSGKCSRQHTMVLHGPCCSGSPGHASGCPPPHLLHQARDVVGVEPRLGLGPGVDRLARQLHKVAAQLDQLQWGQEWVEGGWWRAGQGGQQAGMRAQIGSEQRCRRFEWWPSTLHKLNWPQAARHLRRPKQHLATCTCGRCLDSATRMATVSPVSFSLRSLDLWGCREGRGAVA